MKTIVLEKKLTELGMTPDDLADQLGVQRVTMKQNYMRGQRPSRAIAMAMANQLGMRLEDLFYPDELIQMGFGNEPPPNAA
jgi:DNA-binding XRE family transcriptional regulator